MKCSFCRRDIKRKGKIKYFDRISPKGPVTIGISIPLQKNQICTKCAVKMVAQDMVLY